MHASREPAAAPRDAEPKAAPAEKGVPPAPGRAPTRAQVLALQRTAGNAHVARLLQRQDVPAPVPAPAPGSARPLVPPPLGNMPAPVSAEDAQLVEAVTALAAAERSADGSSYTVRWQNRTATISPEQRAQHLAVVTAALRNNLERAQRRAVSAREGYNSMQDVNRDNPITSGVVHLVTWTSDPGTELNAAVDRCHEAVTRGLAAADAGTLIDAAANLVAADRDAAVAAQTAYNYRERLIGGGESVVRGLEFTRDAALVTVGVLSIIATGGASAGATTTVLGLRVGTTAAATAVGIGTPLAVSGAQALSTAAQGQQVDWSEFVVDTALAVVFARVGGRISDGLFRAMVGHPAVRQAGPIVFGRIASSVLTHELATATTTVVHAVHDQLRGRPVTWDQVAAELVQRMSDPTGIFVAALLGAVQGHADIRHGGRTNMETVDKNKSPTGEIDEIRAGTIYEDKSAKGLGTVNPATGLPGQTEAQWAERQIYNKTVGRLTNIGTAAGTRPNPNVAVGSPDVPTLTELMRVRRYVFRVEADTPALRTAVEAQLVRLRATFPDWTFSATYGP